MIHSRLLCTSPACYKNKLYPAIEQLIGTLTRLEQENAAIVKLGGRTHLQDATPLTLGQEISAWRVMLEETMSMIEDSLEIHALK